MKRVNFHFPPSSRHLLFCIIIAQMLLFLYGCSSKKVFLTSSNVQANLRSPKSLDVQIFKDFESVSRPYAIIGKIHIKNKKDLVKNSYSQGMRQLRQEAAKIGADAIVDPKSSKYNVARIIGVVDYSESDTRWTTGVAIAFSDSGHLEPMAQDYIVQVLPPQISDALANDPRMNDTVAALLKEAIEFQLEKRGYDAQFVRSPDSTFSWQNFYRDCFEITARCKDSLSRFTAGPQSQLVLFTDLTTPGKAIFRLKSKQSNMIIYERQGRTGLPANWVESTISAHEKWKADRQAKALAAAVQGKKTPSLSMLDFAVFKRDNKDLIGRFVHRMFIRMPYLERRVLP